MPLLGKSGCWPGKKKNFVLHELRYKMQLGVWVDCEPQWVQWGTGYKALEKVTIFALKLG